MGNSVWSTAARVLLIFFNVHFLIVSVGLIILGSVFKFIPNVFMWPLGAGLDTLIPIEVSHIQVPKTLDFVPILDDAGVALLVAGVFLFLLAILACFGACCRWRPPLIAFVIIMLIYVVCFAVVGGLFMLPSSTLHKNLKDKLSRRAVEEYRRDDQGAFTQMMNVLNIKLECCGFGGPESYAVDWKNNLSQVPLSCAVNLDTYNYWDWLHASTTNDDFFFKDGCYEKLNNYIMRYKTYVVPLLVVLPIEFLLEVAFAIKIVVDISKDNKVVPFRGRSSSAN